MTKPPRERPTLVLLHKGEVVGLDDETRTKYAPLIEAIVTAPVPLRPLPTMHDLPVLWDGDPVTWGEWHSGGSSADFHVPLAELACHHCGLLESRQIAVGTIERVRVLFAYRCPGCLHDEVWDRRTDDMWELDETDYLPGGSTVRGALW